MKIQDGQILQKARNFCSYQERSQQEVRDKLYLWGLHRQQVEETIAALITENYLNEERFAITYAGGKFRMKQWGRIKIKLALQQKKISAYCQKKALEQFTDSEYRNTIQKLIRQQEKKVVEKNRLKKNHKIARYLISRGFEPELVWDELQME